MSDTEKEQRRRRKRRQQGRVDMPGRPPGTSPEATPQGPGSARESGLGRDSGLGQISGAGQPMAQTPSNPTTTPSGTRPTGPERSSGYEGTSGSEGGGSEGTGLQEKAREMGGEVREEAEERAEHWLSRTGRRADSLSDALHVAGDTLQEDGEVQLAKWSEGAADRVARMADYLEQEDPRSMVRDLKEIARKEPALFIGGSLVAGIALGRFLRASEPSGDGHTREVR